MHLEAGWDSNVRAPYLSEVQLSFAGLRHFSDQQLEDLMTHLPRGVQVFHLDASWLLDLDCNTVKAC